MQLLWTVWCLMIAIVCNFPLGCYLMLVEYKNHGGPLGRPDLLEWYSLSHHDLASIGSYDVPLEGTVNILIMHHVSCPSVSHVHEWRAFCPTHEAMNA
jgi:hypothetical protein